MNTIKLSHKKATIVFAVACITIAGMLWNASSALSSDAAPPANLSPALQEVVKLAQAHLGDDVILAYIKNSAASYTLSADDIVYLKGQGVSQNVISVLLQKGSAGGPAAPASMESAPPPPPPPEAPAPSAATPPAPTQAPPPSAPPDMGSGAPPPAPAPAPAPEPTVNFDYFQQQLSPYGSWINVPGYGQCWQPYGLPYGWRPYYDNGYWVYTDAGLYWQSSYAWGAIPFHYGRWAYVGGYGWIWAPAYEYAPAWVFWRHSGDYVGWAPLPYGAVFVDGGWGWHGHRYAADFDFGFGASFFIFVGGGHLWEHDYHHYTLRGEEFHRVFAASAINRFQRDDHGRFIPEGLDRGHLERMTGHPVVVARHEDVRAREREALRVDHEQRVTHGEPRGGEPRREESSGHDRDHDRQGP
ncbi:MAG: DUF6600 domain-containing protein [Verrucomicrobiia bacterium]|jgi:hypothetical protein